MPVYLVLNKCKLNLNNLNGPDSSMGVLPKNKNLIIWVSNRFVPGTVSTVPS
jgi:hypothetical protein